MSEVIEYAQWMYIELQNEDMLQFVTYDMCLFAYHLQLVQFLSTFCLISRCIVKRYVYLCNIYQLQCLSARATWTDEESEALRQAVKECLEKYRGSKTVNVFCHLPWMEISKKIPTKTNDQCRRRWYVNTSVAYLSLDVRLYPRVGFGAKNRPTPSPGRMS